MRFKRDDVRLGVEIKLKTFLKNCGKVLALFGSPPSVPALSASRCGPGARVMLLDLPSGDSVSVALLARSSPFDAPSTSGRSSARLTTRFATLAVSAMCVYAVSVAASASASSSSGLFGVRPLVTPTGRLGGSKLSGRALDTLPRTAPAKTVHSWHHDGSKPTVFVVSSHDPGDDGAFEQHKAELLHVLTDPELIGRLEWAGTVDATQLPKNIERYEEACGLFPHGLAVLTGTYAGCEEQVWKNKDKKVKDDGQFFALDDGKKMVVTKEFVYASGKLGESARNAAKASTEGTLIGTTVDTKGDDKSDDAAKETSSEISLAEKKALGAGIGVSVAHLLAWRRAFAKRTDSDKIQGGGALVMDTSFNASGEVSQHFLKMLDAATAYRPNDADVVFLDGRGIDGGGNEDDDDSTVVLRNKAWNTDVRFVPVSSIPHSSVPRSGDATGITNPSFYFVTDKFLQTVFATIEADGFDFVGPFLSENCQRQTFTCYATTPGFGGGGGGVGFGV